MPSTSPFCGIPPYIVWTSAEPGRPLAIEPYVGRPFGIPEPLPREKTNPSTIATIASAATAPPIARTRGFAWRRLGAPLDWTGGGFRAAARRACLLFLPLGIGPKSSGVSLFPSGGED